MNISLAIVKVEVCRMMPVGVTVQVSKSDNYAGRRKNLSVHNVIMCPAEGML